MGSEQKHLRGPERKAAADKVGAALLECISTLKDLYALTGEPPEGYERIDVPFADNVTRAVDGIEPLQDLLMQLLYDLPTPPEGGNLLEEYGKLYGVRSNE